jgi:hypothetical protein
MTTHENRERLRDEAKARGIGFRAYAYCADLYCKECAESIIDAIVDAYPAYALTDASEIPCDSNEIPQPIFFSESDYAEHCADCGEYLYGGEG